MASDRRINLLHGKATKALEQKNYQEAIETLNEIVKLAPDDPNVSQKLAKAHYQLGLVEFDTSNYQSAIEKFETALGFDTRSDIQNSLLDAKFKLAEEQFQNNQCNEALNLFLEVRNRDQTRLGINSYIKETRWCKYLMLFGLAGLKNTLNLSKWKHLAATLGGAVLAILVLLIVIIVVVTINSKPKPIPTSTITDVVATPTVTLTPTPYNATDTPTIPAETLVSGGEPTLESATDTPIPEITPTDTPLPEDTPTSTTPNTPTPVPTTDTPVPEDTPTPTPIPEDTPAPANTPTPALQATGKIAVPIFNTTLNTYDLYLASAPNWQLELFQNAASQPVFSPQGDQIMFRSWGGQGISPYAEKLVIRSLTSSADQMVTTHPEDARPDWGTFDRPVVLHTCPNSNCQIYLLGLWGQPGDDNRRIHITDGKYPTWLPDGRIVYSSAYPDGKGMYVINQDKSGRKKIWDNDGLVAPNGSPVGNEVVFSMNDDLYLMTVTDGTSQPRILLNTLERERLPAWSPDGSMIIYVKDHNDEKWAVYVIRPDGSDEKKLFDLPGAIEGYPFNAQVSFGWEEEQLSWVQ